MAGFTEFRLDYTAHVCEKYVPDYGAAVASYFQTMANAPNNVQFRQKKKGVFIIKTFSERDTNIIKNSYVTYYYGPNESKSVKVHPILMEPYKFYQNAKWVTIIGVEDSGLRLAENTKIDEWLTQFGKIIVPTHDDKIKLGLFNGNKKARIDLKTDVNIPRFQEVTLNVTDPESNEIKAATGRVKVYYRDQPVHCRRCDIDHTSKCPVMIREEELAKEEEKVRQSEINSIIIGDSNMRHYNEKALNAHTNSSSGAKIGHVVNAFNENDYDLANIKNVVFQAGQNNVTNDPEVTTAKWQAQIQSECNSLKNCVRALVEKNVNVVLVDVPNSPITQQSKRTKKQQKHINDNFKQIKETCNSIRNHAVLTVTVNDHSEDGDLQTWVDERHFSEVVANGLLETLEGLVSTDESHLIRRGVKLTTEKKYAGVYKTWRMGCEKCTLLGHQEDACIVNPLKRALSDSDERPNGPATTKVK